MARTRTILLALLVALAGCGGSAAQQPAPPVRHVAVIVLENKSEQVTFGRSSPAPYLARTLTARGTLLRNYFGVAHSSTSNYLGMISGQGPTALQQLDCQIFKEVEPATPVADAQVRGDGCVYPASVQTVAGQLAGAGLSARGYFQDLGSACRHRNVGQGDDTQVARPGDTYAARHNPFIFFHSVIDDGTSCARTVVDLGTLRHDFASATTTPQFSLIVPGLCDDGHDQPCRDGRPGGLKSADAFLRTWVPRILGAPGFRRNGLLIVTFDEAEGDGPAEAAACCKRPPSPNGLQPGGNGPGGGRIGAVALGAAVPAGAVSTVPYDHYALLRTVEDLFKLPRLGYAGDPSTRAFGSDVFRRP